MNSFLILIFFHPTLDHSGPLGDAHLSLLSLWGPKDHRPNFLKMAPLMNRPCSRSKISKQLSLYPMKVYQVTTHFEELIELYLMVTSVFDCLLIFLRISEIHDFHISLYVMLL